MTPALIPRLLATLTLSALAAHADILEDIDVRREGVNAVVQIKLATPISFVRATSSRTNDLTQAYYRVRANLSAQPAYVPGERRVIEIHRRRARQDRLPARPQPPPGDGPGASDQVQGAHRQR
jgi:hypothetical protein